MARGTSSLLAPTCRPVLPLAIQSPHSRRPARRMSETGLRNRPDHLELGSPAPSVLDWAMPLGSRSRPLLAAMLPHDLAACLTIISELGHADEEAPADRRFGCMGPRGLGVTKTVRKFRTSLRKLSGVVWHRWKICPEMAIGLDKAVGEGADNWDWLASARASEQTTMGAHHTRVEQILPTT